MVTYEEQPAGGFVSTARIQIAGLNQFHNFAFSIIGVKVPQSTTTSFLASQHSSILPSEAKRMGFGR
jgi:hypothetical protein